MSRLRKLMAVILFVALFIGVFAEIRIEADEFDMGVPEVSVKYINSKTGVKIIIGKTVGADAYKIYINGCGSGYSDYWSENTKNEWRDVATIFKDGSEKRTYTIKGLPKGTYNIKVTPMKKISDDGWFTDGRNEKSGYVTIKTKAPKAVKTNVKEKKYDFSKVHVGDIVVFGSYEQDDIMTNGKEDIEWIVLSKTESQMLIISKYALDCVPYNAEWKDVTWENSTLRKWLNNKFYKTAFTKSERKMVKKTKHENYEKVYYKERYGNDTEDKVFLLSLEDVVRLDNGFSTSYSADDIARRCAPTAYAVANGAFSTEYFKDHEYEGWVNEFLTADGDYPCSWQLRLPGIKNGSTVVVSYYGDICVYGSYDFPFVESAVRPALIINLK